MPHEYSVDQMSLTNNVTDTDVIDASTGFKCYVSISISVPVPTVCRLVLDSCGGWVYAGDTQT
jgi:hypothetical protein